MLTIYGIPNCDTCRKARKWLEANAIEYVFHDVRVDGIERAELARWVAIAGWQKLLNTRSTTWRKIPEGERQNVNENRALDLLLEHPTLIKRPVLETDGTVLVGFTAESYADALIR